MRKFTILLIFFLFSYFNNVYCQKVDYCYLTTNARDIENSADGKDSIAMKTDKINGKDVESSLNDPVNLPSANERYYLVVGFSDNNGKPVTNSDAKIDSVIIKSPKDSITVSVAHLGIGSRYSIVIPLKVYPTNHFCINTQNGDIVHVIIRTKNSSYSSPKDYYFVYWQYSRLYGAFSSNTPLGVWFPTGMFASNFKPTSSGVGLAPTPIGVAFGLKCYPFRYYQSAYIGLSAYASWFIYNQDNTSSDESNSTNQSVNFQAVTIGILADFDNYFTLGVAAGLNFSTSDHGQGLFAVVGLQPGLLNLFKSSSKESNNIGQ